MKHLLFILLFLPVIGFAQTRKDHERAIGRFVKYYNNIQGDSIMRMWENGEREEWNQKMWSDKSLTSMHKDFGKILSYKYLGIDTEDPNPGLAVFETQFSVVGWKTTSMTIDKEGWLGTFRFITSSDGIDKMLKNKKK